MSSSEKIIIGMTGPFGSGCTYISKNILVQNGYEYISLSDILRDSLSKEDSTKSRTCLQDFGNNLRKENGNDFLAKKAIELISQSDKNKFVVDSIRNTHEIETLKSAFSSFFLIATWANQKVRWERVKDKYQNNNSLFEKDDKRDKDEKVENGQQITLCYQMADIIVLNQNEILSKESDSFKELKNIVEKYIKIIEKVDKFEPTEVETLMTMAYANSMRSSCSQRKVGALIIDDYGNVFSSGYNEVPSSERPCVNIYGRCYRKHLREQINQQVGDVLNDAELVGQISSIVKNNSKMLDYCRALHAEENAIVNVAKSGSTQLGKAHLYTTTYPCNLCANKIVQVEIKNVVYFEPYPMEEAKKILQAGNVNQIPFEGVTYNGYFRLMEVVE